jgi:hypothetical protein
VTESLVNQLLKDHTEYTPTYKFCILGVKIGAKSVLLLPTKSDRIFGQSAFQGSYCIHTYIEVSILHTRGKNWGKKCPFFYLLKVTESLVNQLFKDHTV